MGCTLGEIWADYGDPVDLSSEDVVGTWRSGPDPDGRLITFMADGTFAAKYLPNLHSVFDPEDFRYGKGRWEIAAPFRDPDGRRSEVQLHFDQLGGREDVRLGSSIDALRQDNGEIWLIFFDFGSGAGHTAYHKCAESACTSVTGPPDATAPSLGADQTLATLDVSVGIRLRDRYNRPSQ